MRRDSAGTYEVESSLELPAEPAKVIEVLTEVVTEERLARISEIARARTDRVALVLESIDDPHNASAALRSAEAFGVSNVHVVPGRHGFQAARAITKNAHRWLDIERHEDAQACAKRLHEEGYSVYIASMEGDIPPEKLAEEERVAVVFGNEHRGPSPEIRQFAKGTYAIPMRGFVESLNVSVAVAITLYAATLDRPIDTQDLIDARIARMLVQTVRNGDQIVRDAIDAES